MASFVSEYMIVDIVSDDDILVVVTLAVVINVLLITFKNGGNISADVSASEIVVVLIPAIPPVECSEFLVILN